MTRSKNDLWVGLFVALGAVAVLFLALKSANLLQWNFSHDYQVSAKFDNIGGLKVRAPIKSAGVVVGRVTGIGFDNQTFEAVVTMSIDSRYQFPLDTGAKILTSGLLGEQYIGLTPGGGENYLRDGSEIELTQSAMVLEQLISRFLFNKAEGGDNKAEASAAAEST